VKRISAAAALRALPASVRPLVRRIAERGETLGIGVHLVGGPVRDLLLARPLVDVDLLVEVRDGRQASPAATLARRAARAGERSVAHPRFGTAQLIGAGGSVDLAVARSEIYAKPGALPSVAPGTLEQDLARRDFSVNALAIPLNGVARKGRPALVDPHGGRLDLAARRLRILHAGSFHDDPTRALRAARFASRLGFRLEAGSRRALGTAIAARAFDAVSGDRFRAEFSRAFRDAEADLATTLALLDRWHVLPTLAAGLGPGRRSALRRLRTLLDDSSLAAEPLLTGLMVWLAPQAVPVRRRLVKRLSLAGRPAARVLALPSVARRLERWLSRPAPRSADDVRLAPVPHEERLACAAAASAAVRARILAHAARAQNLELPLDGRDLVALGLQGPAVGRALARLRAAVLDGDVRSRAEALAWVRRPRG
jgi:tRNA nucleotidyltransferase (CCA-adding enzyme)